MKKILFLCDGDHFSEGSFRLIKQMREQEPVFVKGFFFTPIDMDRLISISYVQTAEPFVELKEMERELIEKSKGKFIEQCESSRIKYHIQDKPEEWNKELFAKESRFADLVVLSEELFCLNISDNQPNLFMHEALRLAECPVLIIPENFKSIDRIAVAYDGGRESVFAIKQFSYLFPQCAELPAEFVYVKENGSGGIPDADLLEEYSRLHFNSVGVSRLHFDEKKYFNSWLEEKKNVLLVTGSYSRSTVSSLIKWSFTDRVIKEHASPVFIAHHV